MKKQTGRGIFKKGVVALLSAMMIGGTAACSTAVPSVDLNDTKMLDRQYVAAPFIAIMLSKSWDSPEQLDPGTYINYYFVDNDQKGQEWYKDEWKEQYGEDDNGVLIPAEAVEAYVQSHFEVSQEFLRSADIYNAEKNAYAFGGVGSASYFIVNSAKQDGKNVRIFYDFFTPNDIPLGSGELVLEMKSATDYKYRSNRFEEAPTYTLIYPMADHEAVDGNKIVMRSGGTGSVTPADGATVYYDGGDLNSIADFYLNEALPKLEANGNVQAEKIAGGWAWSGSYQNGKPLTIDVVPAGEEFEITAVFDKPQE